MEVTVAVAFPPPFLSAFPSSHPMLGGVVRASGESRGDSRFPGGPTARVNAGERWWQLKAGGHPPHTMPAKNGMRWQPHPGNGAETGSRPQSSPPRCHCTSRSAPKLDLLFNPKGQTKQLTMNSKYIENKLSLKHKY